MQDLKIEAYNKIIEIKVKIKVTILFEKVSSYNCFCYKRFVGCVL